MCEGSRSYLSVVILERERIMGWTGRLNINTILTCIGVEA